MQRYGSSSRRRLGIVLLATSLIGALLMFGLDRVWNLFGSPDLGSVNFENLQRRSSPNDALACPSDLCTARIDISPPEFAMSPSELRRTMEKVIAQEPRIEKVHTDEGSLIDRYVQRSALLGYPDTIVVRYLARPNGRSTIAIYSRSKFGYSDLGVNKARIERWLAKLKQNTTIAN